MTLTTSQKLWGGLLGVGLAALAADRTFGSGAGDAASADAITVDPSARNTPPGGSAESAGPSALAPAGGGERTVAAKLRDLLAGAEPMMRDAFSPPAAWKAPVAVATTTAAPPPDPAGRFKAAHTLKAVIGTGARGHAMVDGSFLSVGQSIDGFRLVGVTAAEATFTAGGETAVLTLPGVAGTARP